MNIFNIILISSRWQPSWILVWTCNWFTKIRRWIIPCHIKHGKETSHAYVWVVLKKCHNFTQSWRPSWKVSAILDFDMDTRIFGKCLLVPNIITAYQNRVICMLICFHYRFYSATTMFTCMFGFWHGTRPSTRNVWWLTATLKLKRFNSYLYILFRTIKRFDWVQI